MVSKVSKHRGMLDFMKAISIPKLKENLPHHNSVTLVPRRQALYKNIMGIILFQSDLYMPSLFILKAFSDTYITILAVHSHITTFFIIFSPLILSCATKLVNNLIFSSSNQAVTLKF